MIRYKKEKTIEWNECSNGDVVYDDNNKTKEKLCLIIVIC